jgi:SM-20-related protein
LNLVFEEIIQSYLDKGIGQSLFFLPLDLASSLKENLKILSINENLVQAGMGSNNEFHEDTAYRKDKIFWLENNSKDKSEHAFQEIIDAFVLYLNQSCYSGISNYEFHYTLYEPGSFYKRHIDQFTKNDSRVFSIIIYLNDDWKLGDGGELVVYQNDLELKIEPKNGTMIFFDSAKLAHEVLETHVPRMSITGWLRRDGFN